MKKIVWVFLLFSFGCSRQQKMPVVHIRVVDSGRSISLAGVDPSIMGEISRDTARDVWENLIPIFRMPADTDMKDFQPMQHGTYRVKDSVVVFTPDTAFVKGKTYFIRYFRFTGGLSTWDMVRRKKKLGSVAHVDLVF